MAIGYRRSIKGYNAGLSDGARRLRALGIDTSDPDLTLLLFMGQKTADGRLKDLSQYGNHGTIYGATLHPAKKYYMRQNGVNEPIGSYYFDGIDDFVEFQPSPSLLNGYDGVSISVVAGGGQISDYSGFWNESGSYDNRFMLFKRQQAMVQWIVDGATQTATTDMLDLSGFNHFFAKIKPDDEIAIWVNGKKEATLTIGSPLIIYNYNVKWVGKGYSTTYYHYGQIRYLARYSRAFTDAEIKKEYEMLRPLLEE